MKFEEKFITLKEVVEICGFKKSTIYKFIKTRNFPQPLKIGKSSRWKLSKIMEWMNQFSSF